MFLIRADKHLAGGRGAENGPAGGCSLRRPPYKTAGISVLMHENHT